MIVFRLKKPIQTLKIESLELSEFIFIQMNKNYFIPYWFLPEFRFNTKKYFSGRNWIHVINNHVMFYKKLKMNKGKIIDVKILPNYTNPDDFIIDILTLLFFGFRKDMIIKIMESGGINSKTTSLTVDILNSSISRYLSTMNNVEFNSEYEWVNHLMENMQDGIGKFMERRKRFKFSEFREYNPYGAVYSLLFGSFKVGVFDDFKIPLELTVKPLTLKFGENTIKSSVTYHGFRKDSLISNVVQYYLLKNGVYRAEMLKFTPGNDGDFKKILIVKNGECKKGTKRDLIKVVNESNTYFDNMKYYGLSSSDQYFFNVSKPTSKHMISDDEEIYYTSYFKFNDEIIFYNSYIKTDKVECVVFKCKKSNTQKLKGLIIEGVLKYPVLFRE